MAWCCRRQIEPTPRCTPTDGRAGRSVVGPACPKAPRAVWVAQSCVGTLAQSGIRAKSTRAGSTVDSHSRWNEPGRESNGLEKPAGSGTRASLKMEFAVKETSGLGIRDSEEGVGNVLSRLNSIASEIRGLQQAASSGVEHGTLRRGAGTSRLSITIRWRDAIRQACALL